MWEVSCKFNEELYLMENKNRSETFILGWLDPRDNTVHQAGVGFYNSEYGEFFLKIDEDPQEKQYFLKPFERDEQGRIKYRMEMVIKRKDGSFLKRQMVGTGYSNEETNGNVFINYGSKFKTLVLYLKDSQ